MSSTLVTRNTNTTGSVQDQPKRDDISWIRDVLIPQLVAGKKLWQTNSDVTVKNVEIRRLSMGEAFMMTACYKIKVTLATSCEAQSEIVPDEVVQMVVKISPDFDEEKLKLYGVSELFHNEETAYNVILPMLGWSDDYPKCYYTHNRADSAAIVLSDFTADGWRMASAMYNLSLEHILVSVAELGRFHGILYGMKHKDRTAFDRVCGEFRETTFVHDQTEANWDRRLRIGPKRAISAVRANSELEKVPESFLNRLEEVLEDTFLYQKRAALRRQEPLAIMCHGDFLRNNIAYKYNSENVDTPEAAMMFDFQTLRYASPMLDLVTFMLNSTGVDVRRPNFDRIFATYHTTLCRNFASFTGITENSADFPDYLSSDAFLQEYALYLPFGLTICASFLNVLHVPLESPIDELIKNAASDEDLHDDAWNRGGEGLDRELRAIVTEMYDLYTALGLELNASF